MGEEIKIEVPTERKDEFKRLVQLLADKMNKAEDTKSPELKRFRR